MRVIPIIILYFISGIHLAQDNITNKVISVAYLTTHYEKKSQKFPLEEYTNLKIVGTKGLYQTYNEIHLDSIRVKRKPNDSELNSFFSFSKATVETNRDTIHFFDVINDREYYYKEILDLNWQITNRKKNLFGYECTKATVNYGGRVWTAWFTPEIPVSLGPYKFHGLPGLIIQVTSEDKRYKIEFHKLFTRKAPENIEKLHHHSKESNRIKMTRLELNAFRHKFNSISLGEKLNYGQPNSYSIKVKKVDDLENNSEMRDLESQKTYSDLVPIEIDHIE